MKVSAKCEYACRAVLELSMSSSPGEPLHIADIALRQQIPKKYLVQIFIQLRKMAIVGSQRGNGGGYYLLGDPDQLSVGEVVRAVDGNMLSVRCDEARAGKSCQMKSSCVFNDIWTRARDALSSVVDMVTFGQLAEQTKRGERTVDYNI